MDRDLRRAWAPTNLKLAWTRLLSRQEPTYKNYFRPIYKSYAVAVSALLGDLRARLVAGHYQTTPVERVFYPKESGIQRPVTLLSVEDQIVYQALVNVVADKLYPKVRRRYFRLVFGNLYAGPRSRYFYKDWKRAYRRFAQAIRRCYWNGFVYTASFDLTACYDSIDHAVLRHFLGELGLSREFTTYLSGQLSNWTGSASAKGRPRIYAGHGVPQGPLSSGLLAECVLRHFDDQEEGSRSYRYFRYVDDIRLFAKTERALRERLVALDLASKEVGLFPQSSKIDLHRVRDIEEEVRSVSHPPETEAAEPDPDQARLRRRLWALTPRLSVPHPTRFKYVLARAQPHAALSRRVIEIAVRRPALSGAVFAYLERADEHSRAVSRDSIAALSRQDVYPGFASGLLLALLDRAHDSVAWRLNRPCRRYVSSDHPVLRGVAAAHLLQRGRLSATQLKYHVTRSGHWWERAFLVTRLDGGAHNLLNRALRDGVPDVAVVAAERAAAVGTALDRPTRDINRAAQRVLRAAGLIGRVHAADDPVAQCVTGTLGGKALERVPWRPILGAQYRLLLPRFVRWAAYATTDPSAWVNLTDTLNDDLLARLYRHDKALGTYVLGKIGSVLGAPTGRLATAYPRLYASVELAHTLRLESDLSHAEVSKTGKRTRRIEFKELPPLRRKLRLGYLELSAKW